jgi:hypothetical protein
VECISFCQQLKSPNNFGGRVSVRFEGLKDKKKINHPPVGGQAENTRLHNITPWQAKRHEKENKK